MIILILMVMILNQMICSFDPNDPDDPDDNKDCFDPPATRVTFSASSSRPDGIRRAHHSNAPAPPHNDHDHDDDAYHE